MAPVINYQSNSELTHAKEDHICLKKRNTVTHRFILPKGTVNAVYVYINIYSTMHHGRNHRMTRVIKHT